MDMEYLFRTASNEVIRAISYVTNHSW